MTNERPNPGSEEAKAIGCKCPVLDNNHGRFPVAPANEDFPNGQWWIASDCEVHAPDFAKYEALDDD